ncbi:MAG: peptidylprolyl isomerase [Proteobacteria bacterium]|nr:peptidylprolyl isomerase [Pseudomonadota bacterium]
MSGIIARSGDLPVGLQTRVTLHFSITLENGERVDSPPEGKPATFDVGDGSVLPGFEKALFGMQSGARAKFLLAPHQAFGEHSPDNVQILARDSFKNMELEPGLIISFAGPGGELPGVVTDLYERSVRVDFNHPLAGRHVSFDVQIVEVRSLAA